MPEKEIWIGSAGPFLFDTTITDDEDSDYGDGTTPEYYVASDWDDHDVETEDPTFLPADATTVGSCKFPVQGYLAEAPTASNHLAQYGTVTERIQKIAVANIDSPTELRTVAGEAGVLMVAYDVEAGSADPVTIYVWDAVRETENLPWIVNDTTSGSWVAKGGKYNAGDLQILPGKKLYFDPDTYFIFEATKLRLYVNGTLQTQWG